METRRQRPNPECCSGSTAHAPATGALAATACSNSFVPICAETFARFAGENVDCWRRIIGCRVWPVFQNWGPGVIEHASWGSFLDHVAPFVHVKMRFEQVGPVRSHAQTWHLHHRQVEVPQDVYAAVSACLEPDLSEEEQADRILRWAKRWREDHDRDALQRATDMEQQARHRSRLTEDR